MKRSIQVTQIILATLAIALVVSLFLGNLIQGQSRDVPASPSTVGPVTPKPVPAGARMPGVPEKKVSEYETFPAKKNENRDRLLDYAAQGTPRVEFEKSLGDYNAYATQVVNWELCADSDTSQCAKIKAPLDWDKPEGDAIEVAVRRVPNGDSSRGPLFLNPGAPASAARASRRARRSAGRTSTWWAGTRAAPGTPPTSCAGA
ncbi:hypothetical protein BW730_17830 [Tessaracoccus aquimaris]|uniref:Uncharacterized protein n=1 Tax=Tessaracoccus aquimaris TaxID=1332264 RepID=A0A1Q2CSI3_9ACTN|nr:hypothetical protein [Tessaracoccus aquimaris]AQP49076.1 hypothetical protein BW730_17830 [Tessaracoccus aquimaris]